MIEVAEVFSMTTTTTWANAGTDAAALVFSIGCHGAIKITPDSSKPNRAARPNFTPAFLGCRHRGFRDQWVNFLAESVVVCGRFLGGDKLPIRAPTRPSEPVAVPGSRPRGRPILSICDRFEAGGP